MCHPDQHVTHVVAGGISDAKLDVLRAVCTRPETVSQVVQLGGRTRVVGLPTIERAAAPLGLPWMSRVRRLRRRAAAARGVIHAWSPATVGWALAQAEAARPGTPGVIVQLDGADDVERAARWSNVARRTSVPLGYVCATATAQRRLAQAGVEPTHSALVRESVDFAVINAARLAKVRERIAMPPDATVIVLLPTGRRGAMFQAAWAGLLLQKVLPGVRLIVPGRGPEVDRLRRLATSIGQERVVLFGDDQLSLCELLGAANLACALPHGDAATAGLMWAMAAGVPIVASAVSAVAELLAHGHNAWLCQPHQPADAARRMLQALESLDAARQYAERGRTQAFRAFGRQRMIEQYQQVYANTLAGRPPGEGVRDSLQTAVG